MSKPLLQVIVASVRTVRVGRHVADWFVEEARKHGAFDVELVDLRDVNLPFHDEPHHPRTGNYVHEHTIRWSETISRADAFVFVHPEYNFGFSAPLKNAIDYLNREWQRKPVTFVSYGGISAGLRAAQMLKQVVTTLGMVPGMNAVPIPFVATHIDDGRFQPTGVMNDSVVAALDELVELHGALAPLRK